jgi:hypothetical protein
VNASQPRWPHRHPAAKAPDARFQSARPRVELSAGDATALPRLTRPARSAGKPGRSVGCASGADWDRGGRGRRLVAGWRVPRKARRCIDTIHLEIARVRASTRRPSSADVVSPLLARTPPAPRPAISSLSTRSRSREPRAQRCRSGRRTVDCCLLHRRQLMRYRCPMARLPQ